LLIEPESGKVLPPILVAGVLGIMFLLIAWRAYLAMRSLVASREKIHYLATHDDATGLRNFMGLAEMHVQKIARDRGQHALLLLRLSQLHEVGQLWGLAIRDAWIARVAAALASATANIGQLARVGNDQFALLASVPDADVSALDMIARRMAASVRSVRVSSDLAGSQQIVSAFDIGIASAHDNAPLNAMMREAESAIAIAHTNGENRIAHYDAGIAAAEQRRLALLTQLHGAVERDEFTLHYQPVVDMATRAVVFHEALLRWRTADLGDISPVEFIPLAESIDEIEHITDWVMNKACAALVASDNLHVATRGYRISINISAHSLQRPGLARRMMAALVRHRLRTTDICLELTERTQMEDPHGELGMLRARGFALAIDDFGSGYSNLSMLARITADTIKLDISFVRAIEADASMRDLCASLLAQVSKQGAKVVAEGIETQAQHDLLLSLGCHYGQGWLYGRPSAQFAPANRARDVG
jgi:diguanylate cyclase